MTTEPVKAQAFPIVFDQGIVDVVNLMMSIVDGNDHAVTAKWFRSLEKHGILDDWFRFADEFDQKVHDHEMCPDPECLQGKSKEEKSKDIPAANQKSKDDTRKRVRDMYEKLPPDERRTSMLADYVMECMEQGLLAKNTSNIQLEDQMNKDLLSIKSF
jgi:hypothetical protein